MIVVLSEWVEAPPWRAPTFEPPFHYYDGEMRHPIRDNKPNGVAGPAERRIKRLRGHMSWGK